MTDLIPLDDPEETALALDRVRLTRQVGDYLEESMAYNTRRAYASDWRHFVVWCDAHQLAPLPADPATVAMYIAHLAEDLHRKTTTIERKLASIRHYHAVAGFQSPTDTTGIELTMKGVRRKHGEPAQGKAPTLTETIEKLVEVCPPTLIGLRDRALFLIGFAGAFRRSALVALDVRDATFQHEGLVLMIRADKTDKERKGRELGIAYGSNPQLCPVRTLRTWLDAACITEGPIFRSFTKGRVLSTNRIGAQDVARVIKRHCAAAGLDPRAYAGHSLRAGMATQAAMNGVPEWVIAEQTGHTSTAVLRKYIRKGNLFRENASKKLGL